MLRSSDTLDRRSSEARARASNSRHPHVPSSRSVLRQCVPRDAARRSGARPACRLRWWRSFGASGLEIAYERVGEGPPLVLVHGAAVHWRMWQPQLAALVDEFTVVAWDEPGAGHSSNVPADFGLADYANCLAALIGALDLGPAHGPTRCCFRCEAVVTTAALGRPMLVASKVSRGRRLVPTATSNEGRSDGRSVLRATATTGRSVAQRRRVERSRQASAGSTSTNSRRRTRSRFGFTP